MKKRELERLNERYRHTIQKLMVENERLQAGFQDGVLSGVGLQEVTLDHAVIRNSILTSVRLRDSAIAAGALTHCYIDEATQIDETNLKAQETS